MQVCKLAITWFHRCKPCSSSSTARSAACRVPGPELWTGTSFASFAAKVCRSLPSALGIEWPWLGDQNIIARLGRLSFGNQTCPWKIYYLYNFNQFYRFLLNLFLLFDSRRGTLLYGFLWPAPVAQFLLFVDATEIPHAKSLQMTTKYSSTRYKSEVVGASISFCLILQLPKCHGHMDKGYARPQNIP